MLFANVFAHDPGERGRAYKHPLAALGVLVKGAFNPFDLLFILILAILWQVS